MPDVNEYYVILREPGSELALRPAKGWVPVVDAVQYDRGSAHDELGTALALAPKIRAIVARVRETTVEEPERTVWVVRDAEGRYLAPEADWSKHRSGAMHFFRRDAAVRELFGYPAARSIEPIEIPGETKIVREILPEVEP